MMEFTEEMENLSFYLSIIASVLQDAEEKRLKDNFHALDVWLVNLEDALYILDDLLDDYSTELLKVKDKATISCDFLSLLPLKKLRFRHKIEVRMRVVKEQLHLLEIQKNLFFLQPDRQASSFDTNISRCRQTFPAMIDDCIYERETEKNQLVSQLIDNAANLVVLTIVGMGGIGKTTLAQLVYQDKNVQDHFQLKMWICVSENFELEIMIKSILGTPESNDSLEMLEAKLQQTLQGNRYLLVLDDVWNDNPQKWNQLKCLISCGARGSAVLVTTRQEKVAIIMKTPVTLQSYYLTCLSDEACWEVFRKLAFGLSAAEESGTLVSIGKEIVKECEVVPLAAKGVGGLLSLNKDVRVWTHVQSKLWNLSTAEDSLYGVLKLSYLNLPTRVRKCFTFCSLFPKSCRIDKVRIIHLWMANDLIHSEFETIETEKVGEGIVEDLYWRSLIVDIEKDEDGNIVSFKLHDLIHDFAHYIVRNEVHSVDETISQVLKPNVRHICFSEIYPDKLLKNLKGLRTCILQVSNGEFPTVYEHKSLRALDLSDMHGLSSSILDPICSLSHLKYLNLSHTDIQGLPDSFCKLWNLQILNLDCCYSLRKLSNTMGQLKSLQYLYLKDCTSLSSLPMSISLIISLRSLTRVILGDFNISALGKFEKLGGEIEIINLERVNEVRHAKEANLKEKFGLDKLTLTWNRDESHIPDLHHELQILEALEPCLNLKNLKLCNYRGTRFPNWMQIDMASFSSIRWLWLEDCCNCTQLPPLWSLPYLRYLGLFRLRDVRYLIEDVSSHGFQSLQTLHLQYLESLEGIAEKKNTCLQFPRLSRLIVRECKKFNPKSDWDLLPSLQFLVIDDVNLPPLTNVNSLPSLEVLKIGCSNSLTFPDLIFQGLDSVKRLAICSCVRLKSLPQSLMYLTSLEEMEISDCPELTSIPDYFQSLTNLKRLFIDFCPNLCTRCKKDLGEDWKKIAHIPLVYLDAYPQ